MSKNPILTGKLSNVQLELMKLFVSDVSEEELKELKKLLLAFKFNRVTALTDKLWEDKGWSNEDMDNLLKTHLRTPYKAQEKYLKQKTNK